MIIQVTSREERAQPWDENGRDAVKYLSVSFSTDLGCLLLLSTTFTSSRSLIALASSCDHTSTPDNGDNNSEIMSTATAAPTPTTTAGTTNVGGANAAAVFKRLHPASYLSRFLSSGYRPDGRPILPSSSSSSQPTASASAADDVWRQVSINTGSISTAHGSALVRMGDTTMVCGVKAEIGEPDTETPGEGFIGEL